MPYDARTAGLLCFVNKDEAMYTITIDKAQSPANA
jgi:hypothetical protein